MNPDDIPWPHRRYNAPLWDTPEYWAKREAREKLMLAKQRARKDRPRRKADRKRSLQSKRRNRRAA
jgi:hypothetical protein